MSASKKDTSESLNQDSTLTNTTPVMMANDAVCFLMSRMVMMITPKMPSHVVGDSMIPPPCQPGANPGSMSQV